MSWQQVLEMNHQPVATGQSLTAWYADLVARHPTAGPLELAVFGGYLAASPGLAFLAGYQAALRALWPAAPGGLGALCVTEQRSSRPADLHSRLSDNGLSGSKDFVAGGGAAAWLLVAARVEAEGEKARLAAVLLDATAAGVSVEPGPLLAMLPDVPHSRLRLTDARGERLPGDGWADYVKPFRTLEDLHVLAALCAWVFGVAVRQAWPLALRLRLLAVLSGCAGASGGPLHSPAGHLALAAVSASFATLRGELEQAFAAGPAETAEQWRRDQRVLDLAQPAREKRLENALAALGLAAVTG